MAGISSVLSSGVPSSSRSLLGAQSGTHGEGTSQLPEQESEPVVIDLSNKSVQREMVYSSVQSQGQTQTTVANDGSKQSDSAQSSTNSKDGESQEGDGQEEKTDDGPPPTTPAIPNLLAMNSPFFTEVSQVFRIGGADFAISRFPTGGNSFTSAGTAYYGGGSKSNAAGGTSPSSVSGQGTVSVGSALPLPQLGAFGSGAPGQVAGFEVFDDDFQPVVPAGSGPEVGGVFNPQAAGSSPGLDAVTMLSAFAEGELARMSELAASLAQGFEPFAFSPARQNTSLGQLLDAYA
jgi:hypothetical protein